MHGLVLRMHTERALCKSRGRILKGRGGGGSNHLLGSNLYANKHKIFSKKAGGGGGSGPPGHPPGSAPVKVTLIIHEALRRKHITPHDCYYCSGANAVILLTANRGDLCYTENGKNHAIKLRKVSRIRNRLNFNPLS